MSGPVQGPAAGTADLPLFMFLPKLIQPGLNADVDVMIAAFGKNKQVKKVFWALFITMAGPIWARVLGPVTSQEVVGMGR